MSTMRFKAVGSLLLGLALALTLSISARSDGDREGRDCRDSDHHEESRHTPVGVVGVIPIPGAPVTSADIAWADSGTERYYFTDRSNSAVDIIDAEDNVFVGRVTGFVGNPPAPNTGGGTATTNGPGPNGVLVTPDRKLWAGDGNSLTQVADADPNSANYLKILQPGGISTAIAACDGGSATTHFCGRADELGYDPKDKIILIANNAPLAVKAPHGPIDPYATFIDAKTFKVNGHISFAGSQGLEQPIWDAEKQRFLITVPGATNAAGTVVTLQPSIQVINPITMTSGKPYFIDCQAVAGTVSSSITGIAIGPFGHILVSACGFPITLTLNATTGKIHVINVVKQVGGGDEVWFNPGDGRFYVTSALNGVGGNQQELGVIDAENGAFLQNVPQLGLTAVGTRGKNPAAFAENNHIYTIQQINAAIVAAPATDDSVCAKFGFKGTGCIAIFEHKDAPDSSEASDGDDGDHHDGGDGDH
jgi:hypothetical protein